VAVGLAWIPNSPLVPLHGGHPGGNRTWSTVFLGLLAAAAFAYLIGVLLIRFSPAGTMAVGVVACAIQLVPLGAPLLLSTDAWTYWDYGRIAAVDGGNPYRDQPAHFASDPAYPHIGTAWRRTTSVYGPAFTLASEPLSLAAGSSADAAAWIWKALGAAATLAAAFLAARLSRRPGLALAAVGWNPVLAVHFAGGGHNDAWVAALVVGGLALAAAGRRQFAGAFWALGALVKWIPVVLLPLRLIELYRRRERSFGWAGLVGAAAAVVGVAFWRYGGAWLGAIRPLAEHANHETSFAFPHRLTELGVPHGVSIGIFIGAFALGYLWLLTEAWRGRARLGLAAAFAIFAIPYLAPWYLIWTLPLAAAEDDDSALVLGLVLSGYVLGQTIRT
jgi:hypothetical protein